MTNLRSVVAILFLVLVAVGLIFFAMRSRKQQNLLKAARTPSIRRELKKGEVPQIQVPADSRDFVDLTFGVGQIQRQENHTIIVPLRAQFQNEYIGFSVRLPTQISAGLLGSGSNRKVRVVPEGVQLLRDGDTSDRFVTVLDRLYGIGNQSLLMAQTVKTTAVNLASIDQQLDRDLIQLKLFFDDQATNEEDYAECYLNLDISHNYVEFAEKDLDYRKPLIHALIAN